MKIVQLDPATLVPYEHNARTHEPLQVKQIIASIEEFGFTNPILIDADKGIIAGHGRVEAALRMELKKVPTITLNNLTPEQKRAYILADNKIALNSGWDEDLLIQELEQIEGMDLDFEMTGFSLDEFDALQLGQLANEEDDSATSIASKPEGNTNDSADDSVMFSAPVSDEQYNAILDAITICKSKHKVKHTGTALAIICKEWSNE